MFMKRNIDYNKVLIMAFIILLLSMLPFNASAASKTKLSETKKAIRVGDTATIKILNNKKNVKWSVSNKNVKIMSQNNKQAKIKGIKKGTSYLNAKIGKKTYKCKITVKNANLPHGKDIGQGEMYISTAGGTSENGKIPKVLSRKDMILIQIGLNAWGFDGSHISYVYIDDKLIGKYQLSDTQTSIDLTGSYLKKGTHRVSVVQFKNNKKTGEIITYKEAKYKIVY